MEHKIQILLIGLAGTVYGFAMDNGDAVFEFARWVPIVLSSSYVGWKWYRDIKKK